MTDVKIIGSAAQPDPPGTVTVICNCRTTSMQREEQDYVARCRRCGIATKVHGLSIIAGPVATPAPYQQTIQERTY